MAQTWPGCLTFESNQTMSEWVDKWMNEWMNEYQRWDVEQMKVFAFECKNKKIN